MDAKKKQVESEEYRREYRREYREERYDAPEFEVPEEMETWALDDMTDLLPTTFD
jgi:hypothetical protein